MKLKVLVLALIALALLAAAAYSMGWFHHDNALRGAGTVEARNIRVGSKVGGRIDQVLVREGDRVEAGQLLVTFDDKELQAALNQSRAAAAQAKADYELKKNGYRREDIDAAKADLDRASADESRSQLDYQRYEALAQKDLVSKQQRDTAEANWKMALAQKQMAQQKLDQLQRGYRPEEVASAEARYRQAE